MATTNSNSNTQTKSALHKDANRSTLHCIISNAHLLHQTGYDEEKRMPTYVGEINDISYLEGAADATITTIGFGISAIGKLLVHQDEKMDYFDEQDISALGWLLSDLGASIVALQNIQSMADDAVTLSRNYERKTAAKIES